MSLELESLVDAAAEVDLCDLMFDRLSGMSLDQVRAQAVVLNGFSATLGECFRVSGSTDEPHCRILPGDCRRVHGIGAKMRVWRLTVDGDAGDRLGCEMRGGAIEVRGSAGHFAGAPSRGARTGMRGGVIAVGGNVGQFCGFRMRRGTMLIQGAAQKGLATEMVAGTVFVGQPDWTGLGFAMRRGTVVVLGPVNGLPKQGITEFSDATPVDDVFFRLLSSYLADLCGQLGLAVPQEALRFRQPDPAQRGSHFEAVVSRNWQRVIGDRAVGGLGEIWMEGQAAC